MAATGATIAPEALERLRSSLEGQVITPDDPAYDEARALWNGMIDRRPALIVRARGAPDVLETVNFARGQGLPVAVRGGGHNVAGGAMSQGGVTLDLSDMNSVTVDPQARTVRAEGGVRLLDLDRESQKHRLAVPAGVVSDTGVAGLTLGGGVGWLRRKYGTTSDNVISMDVVTADGRQVVASKSENADLFWALRGGGLGIGVVTAFTYRAYPLGPDVYFSAVFYPHSQAKAILQALREYGETAPDEVNIVAVFGTVPEAEGFPSDVHGERFVAFVGAYAGPPEEGERVLEPLRQLAEPLVDLSGVIPYVEAQRFFDEDYPSGMRYYWKATYLRELSDEAIDAIVGRAETYPSPLTTIDLWLLGGALARPREDTAFANRDAPYMLTFESNWVDADDDQANLGWSRAGYDDLQRFSTGGLYANFPGFQEGGEADQRFVAGAGWKRLQAVKRRHDPDDLFRAAL